MRTSEYTSARVNVCMYARMCLYVYMYVIYISVCTTVHGHLYSSLLLTCLWSLCISLLRSDRLRIWNSWNKYLDSLLCFITFWEYATGASSHLIKDCIDFRKLLSIKSDSETTTSSHHLNHHLSNHLNHHLNHHCLINKIHLDKFLR